MTPFPTEDGVPLTIDEDDYAKETEYHVNYENQSLTFCDVVTETTNVMKVDRRSVKVIGIALLDEREIGKSPATGGKNTVLGGVCVENVKVNAEELRRLMCSELPSIPASFSFLTKEGWPVCKRQERILKAHNLINEQGVICIQKQFEKQRIGVVESEGDSLGFVFADLNCNVRQLRDVIEQQLKLSLLMKSDYRFIERNGWPLTLSQETELSVMDIISGCNVYVKSSDKLSFSAEKTTEAPALDEHTDKSHRSINCNQHSEPVTGKIFSRFYRSESQPFIKFQKSGSWKKLKHKEDRRSVKPILISYVRAEAAQHALDLKKELVQMGFSVYLDVHEIKTGTDWQDDLNFAVTNCYLFIPLITPRYGKTQWTNREIKLADVLGKLIIPVNFMDTWPPACLAIQFASTQYIPWKALESDRVQSDKERASDPRTWDPIHLMKVSKQIAQVYEENYHKWPLNSKVTVSYEHWRAGSAKLRDESSAVSGEESTAEERKQLIVISAHPYQKCLASNLKSLFKKDGHQVWCSTDLCDTQDDFCLEDGISSNPDSPRDLPPIPEEDVFFTSNDDEASLAVKRISLFGKGIESYEQRSPHRLMSDLIPPHVPCFTREKLPHLSIFQRKVDQAGVVVVLVSEAYTKSTFSQQQVFYCEHRKRVVLVKCDNSVTPKWFRLLMGNDIIMRDNNKQFEGVVKSRVKRALNPTTSETPKDATTEAKVKYLVNFLMRNLPLQDKCVYIAGSSKLQTQRAEEICRAVGRELAKMKNVSLVTGGFYGAADITAKTFCECKEKGSQYMQEDSSVVHILPMHDSEDLSSKSRQNPDGSFEAVPYGKTVFLGDSVKEKETVVARILDTCIVIEGGHGVVHEIEEFIWNDHFVIPIISTGGAAGGQYGVPVKIFELPPGVDEADWSVLSDKECTPDEVAKAVVNIIVSLKNALFSPSSTVVNSPFPPKSWKKSMSMKCLFQDHSATTEETDDSPTSTPSRMRADTMRSHFERLETSEGPRCKKCNSKTLKQSKWWQKLF